MFFCNEATFSATIRLIDMFLTVWGNKGISYIRHVLVLIIISKINLLLVLVFSWDLLEVRLRD